MTRLLATASAVALLALPLLAQEATEEAAPAAEAPATEAPATEAPAPEAPAEAPADAAEAPTRDTLVASVNGTPITLGEVIVAAASLPPQYRQLPPDILFGAVVDQLVQQELLAQTVTQEPGRVTIALLNERRSLLAGEVVDEIAATAVTDEALQAAYDAAFADQPPATEWSASHILVATEEEAQAVEARLAAGEDFAALAQELSMDTGSGAQGGALGWFGPGAMVPEFEAGVAALRPGQVSAPVQSQFGWHVIRLDETRPVTPPSLEEVRGDLEGQVRQAAIEARLAELEAAGGVERPDLSGIDPAVVGDLSLVAQ